MKVNSHLKIHRNAPMLHFCREVKQTEQTADIPRHIVAFTDVYYDLKVSDIKEACLIRAETKPTSRKT